MHAAGHFGERPGPLGPSPPSVAALAAEPKQCSHLAAAAAVAAAGSEHQCIAPAGKCMTQYSTAGMREHIYVWLKGVFKT